MTLMRTPAALFRAALFMALCTAGIPGHGQGTNKMTAGQLRLVPLPRSVAGHEGQCVVPVTARVAAKDPALLALANVLQGEIGICFGHKLSIAQPAEAGAGDIGLEIDDSLGKDEYLLDVSDRVRVMGGSYEAAAMGTVTLLQALAPSNTALILPRMSVKDSPTAGFRGLMIDLARNWHSVRNLQQCILLCREYKIGYLQLHLTDDPSFTFQSRAYPELATPGRSYTVAQLKELDQFASERGVTLVPELEMPGHSLAAKKAMPALFGTEHGHYGTLNFAKPEAAAALDTLIGELLEVFRSSPYFHIGSDECNLKDLEKDAEFQRAMEKAGVETVSDLFRKFIVARNDVVKRHGKRMIVW